MIIDIMFAIATILFVISDTKQVHKLYKVKKVRSLSFTHYKLKIIALVLMTLGYTLSKLYISVIVSLLNYTLAVILLGMMISYSRDEYKFIKVKEEW